MVPPNHRPPAKSRCHVTSLEDTWADRVWISCLAIAFCPGLQFERLLHPRQRAPHSTSSFRAKFSTPSSRQARDHARCTACHAGATGMRLSRPAGSQLETPDLHELRPSGG